jgi:tRNA threonylcarbamoyladenosine biosynthesis protein TsaE
MNLKTTSPEETKALGERLGRLLKGLDVVCLFGNLGSGKTTMTQGLARGAGFKGRVMSPTFGLARVYPGKRWTIYHLDLYRVGEGETGDIGLEDFLSDPRAFCVVEWPEAGRGYWPKDRLEVRLSSADGGRTRKIAFKAAGPRSREVLKRLKAA